MISPPPAGQKPSIVAEPVRSPTPTTIRAARLEDIPDLLALEEKAFATDRISRRSFHHILTRGHAISLLAEREGLVAGYALVFLRRGTSLARLYSLAVDPAFRGLGIGETLLNAAEVAAAAADALFMRLEVRADNEHAIKLYRHLGYRSFGRYVDYYEDHAEALRFEKRLDRPATPRDAPVPYYPQSTEFTCGPAALMMAMRAHDPSVELSRRMEIQLWREATTIYMASGHGGCGPFGLALAAHRRGFKVRVQVSGNGYLFLDSVRSEEKKAVMRLVQDEFRREADATDIEIVPHPMSLEEITASVDAGAFPVILVSLYRLTGEKAPHWIVVHGYDSRFVYAHDPFIDPDELDVAADKISLPIPRWAFERMARYGKSRLRAAVVVEKRKA